MQFSSWHAGFPDPKPFVVDEIPRRYSKAELDASSNGRDESILWNLAIERPRPCGAMPGNPLVALFRQHRAQRADVAVAHLAAHFLGSVWDMGRATGASGAQIEHARRVLRRLALLDA